MIIDIPGHLGGICRRKLLDLLDLVAGLLCPEENGNCTFRAGHRFYRLVSRQDSRMFVFVQRTYIYIYI